MARMNWTRVGQEHRLLASEDYSARMDRADSTSWDVPPRKRSKKARSQRKADAPGKAQTKLDRWAQTWAGARSGSRQQEAQFLAELKRYEDLLDYADRDVLPILEDEAVRTGHQLYERAFVVRLRRRGASAYRASMSRPRCRHLVSRSECRYCGETEDWIYVCPPSVRFHRDPGCSELAAEVAAGGACLPLLWSSIRASGRQACDQCAGRPREPKTVISSRGRDRRPSTSTLRGQPAPSRAENSGPVDNPSEESGPSVVRQRMRTGSKQPQPARGVHDPEICL